MTDLSLFPIRDNIDVPAPMLDAWQRLLDLMAEVFHVPSALIMRVHAHEIEVFLRSANRENVYQRGERAALNTGLYCETVMGTRSPLLVPNATRDPVWDHNPDIKLGMIAYLGFPLVWPTGQLFGTMCVLDHKENRFSDTYIRLLEQLKNVVEHDLRLLDADIQLRASEVRYRTMFNSVLDGIFVSLPDGRIVDSNPVAREQLGSHAPTLTPLSITDIIRFPCDWSSEIIPGIASDGVFRCDGELLRGDGERVPMEFQVVRMTVDGENMVVTVAHDITERKNLERELHRMAFTDPLTGVGNRGGFEAVIMQELTQAERYGRNLAVAMLDLDHFKGINDQFGHETGDRVLRHICGVTAIHLRHADQFFRYGGEEFVIVMPETDLEGARHLADRIRQSIAASPIQPVGVVTVSIGVTQYRAGDTRNQLINRVDSALYAAKAAGRNGVKVS